jgi:hypothetical protein
MYNPYSILMNRRFALLQADRIGVVFRFSGGVLAYCDWRDWPCTPPAIDMGVQPDMLAIWR